MTSGMHRTLGWFAATPAIEIARAAAKLLSRVRPIFAAAIERYRALGLWGPDPVIRREGYDRLHAAMRSAGTLQARHRLRDLRRHQPRRAGGQGRLIAR